MSSSRLDHKQCTSLLLWVYNFFSNFPPCKMLFPLVYIHHTRRIHGINVCHIFFVFVQFNDGMLNALFYLLVFSSFLVLLKYI